MKAEFVLLLSLAILGLVSVTSAADDDDDYDYYFNDPSDFEDDEDDFFGDGAAVDSDVESTTFCPWGGNCFNEGKNKNYDDILKTDVSDAGSDEVGEEQTPVGGSRQLAPREQRPEYDYAAGAEAGDFAEDEEEELVLELTEEEAEDVEPCPDTIVIYKRFRPNGVIITSVVFFVVIVGIVFYFPRCYKARQQKKQQQLAAVPTEDYEEVAEEGRSNYEGNIVRAQTNQVNVQFKEEPTF